MTIYKIEADLIETTMFCHPESYTPGQIRLFAQGGGHFHDWPCPFPQRFWIGDAVTVHLDIPQDAERPATEE